MLIQVLDRLLIIVSLYFLYMIIFHLPSSCDLSSSSPSPSLSPSPSSSPSIHSDPLSTYPAFDENQVICPKSEEADKLLRNFLEIQRVNLDKIKVDGKFVIYSATDTAGFGNRIPAMMSSFVLALLLGRGFLVHWPEVSHSNITDQFDETSVVMPIFSDLFLPPVPIDILAIPSYYAFFDDATAIPIKLDESADLLLCNDIENNYEDKQFIVIRGYRPFFDLLFHNTHLAARAQALGFTRTDSAHAVHALASCLLRPVPQVFDIVKQFREDNEITQRHKLVGIHIRKQSQHGLTEKEQEGLWSCVRKKYPPPDMWKNEEWGEINEKEKEKEKEKEDERKEKEEKAERGHSKIQNATYLYFLASDSESTIDLVPPEFLPYVVRLPGGISRNSTSGLIRALADIWILGHSIEVFGAQGTTFLSAVRTLFPSKSNLAVLGGKKVDKYCRPVGELPCYKWWDIFESRNVPEFKLSCFSANTSIKHIVVC